MSFQVSFLSLSYRILGQVISAAKEDIIRAYYPGYFIQAVSGQIQTKQAHSLKDDSYQGKLIKTLQILLNHMSSCTCHES